MEEAFQAILDSLPPKPARSKLEPYAELIRELRKRGRSYREIASILAERCGVRVGIHTVYNFVQVRNKAKSKPSTGEREKVAAAAPSNSVAETSSPVPGDVDARIQALKQRTTAARAPGAEKVFHYDENEPLRLQSSSEQKRE
jgi:IS30 family transposase